MTNDARLSGVRVRHGLSWVEKKKESVCFVQLIIELGQAH